jgi:hypothetical protein
MTDRQVLVNESAVTAIHDAVERISGAVIALLETRAPEQRSATDRYIEDQALAGVEALAHAVLALGGRRG